jgi:hypothetical protein
MFASLDRAGNGGQFVHGVKTRREGMCTPQDVAINESVTASKIDDHRSMFLFFVLFLVRTTREGICTPPVASCDVRI